VSSAQEPLDLVQQGREVAWAALNRRERTEAELRWLLLGKRVAPQVIDQVVAELVEQGYLDDASYARRFAEDRRRLDAWGSERIERRLLAAGVAPEHIAAALGDGAGELDAALALLRHRVPQPPATPRERDRALGLLLRKGYEAELAYDAVRRHARTDEAF
jgi:regulatory protein